jgi:hypothetical protein
MSVRLPRNALVVILAGLTLPECGGVTSGTRNGEAPDAGPEAGGEAGAGGTIGSPVPDAASDSAGQSSCGTLPCEEQCIESFSSASPDCASCACTACPQQLYECYKGLACKDIRTCAMAMACVGTACYDGATCQRVIDEFGGPEGAPSPYSVFLELSECLAAHACRCFESTASCKCDGRERIFCPDGSEQRCDPYRCSSDGLCLTTCRADADCAAGYECHEQTGACERGRL